MTLQQEFIDAAKEIVDEFSIGTATLRKVTVAYNDSTGTYGTPSVVDTPFPVAIGEVSEKYKRDAAYTNQFIAVYAAGVDLGAVVPDNGDLIILPDLSEHEIKFIEGDQYSAHYEMHIARFSGLTWPV